MSITVNTEMSLGNVIVDTTENSGHSIEYWAEKATHKIIQYSDNVDPVLQQQAKEFKNTIYTVCLLYTSPSPRDVEESRMPASG